MLGIDALVFLDNNLARTVSDVKVRNFAFPAIRHKLEHAAFFLKFEIIEIREMRQDGFGRHADSLEQYGDRHFAATVDTEEQDVLGVELEVQPRAAVRNHASREQQLARAMRFTAVVLEENPW